MTLKRDFRFLEVAYPYVARRLLTDEDPALRERLLQVRRPPQGRAGALCRACSGAGAPLAHSASPLPLKRRPGGQRAACAPPTHMHTAARAQVLFQDGKFQWKRLENLIALAREGGGAGLDLSDTMKDALRVRGGPGAWRAWGGAGLGRGGHAWGRGGGAPPATAPGSAAAQPRAGCHSRVGRALTGRSAAAAAAAGLGPG
jgi:hypothetical protein